MHRCKKKSNLITYLNELFYFAQLSVKVVYILQRQLMVVVATKLVL